MIILTIMSDLKTDRVEIVKDLYHVVDYIYGYADQMAAISEYVIKVQKNAYNKGVEDSAENAKCERSGHGHDHLTGLVSKESILKLLKKL
jgi:hypothetical protein